MATMLVRTCVICQADISGQRRRIIGLDQSRWPDTPPISIYACPDCAARLRGAIVIHPGQTLADLLPVQPALL